MKLVKIRILNPSVETEVRTQAESRGFVFIEYKDNVMVFKKENDQIGGINDLKYLPDLGPFISID
jgi:hypothetical protein